MYRQLIRLCLFLLIPSLGNSQDCPTESKIVFSPHFMYTTNQLGGGFEVGLWKGPADGRFSFFGGATLAKQSTHTPKSTDSLTDLHSIFYAKTMFTLVRYPGVFHAYAVASAGIKDFEKFVPELGFRFVLPVRDNLGIAVEPLYDFKHVNWYARVVFAL